MDILWNYTQVIDNIDVKADNITDWESENKVKSQAKEYVWKRIKEWISKKQLEELINEIKTLLARQDVEKLNLKETLKQNIKTETKESLNIEKLIQDTKLALYDKLWINFDLQKNPDVKKFLKWLIDWLILNNIETLHQIINAWIDNFIAQVKELLTISWVLEFVNSLKDELTNIWDIFAKPYDWWVVIWWYGLWFIWKWFKWLNLFRKAEKVEHKVSHTPELWSLNDAVPWKVSYRKMFEASKYEIDMIWDKSRNLQAILKDFDPKDRFIVENLNKKANLWIEARLWNIKNMLDYAIAHPWDLKDYKEMVTNWVSLISDQMSNYSSRNVLHLDWRNVTLAKSIREKILLINNK